MLIPLRLKRLGAFGVERNWIIPALIFIAVQQAICVTVGSYHQFHGSPPYIPYGLTALTAFGLVALCIGMTDVRRMMPPGRIG